MLDIDVVSRVRFVDRRSVVIPHPFNPSKGFIFARQQARVTSACRTQYRLGSLGWTLKLMASASRQYGYGFDYGKTGPT